MSGVSQELSLFDWPRSPHGEHPGHQLVVTRTIVAAWAVSGRKAGPPVAEANDQPTVGDEWDGTSSQAASPTSMRTPTTTSPTGPYRRSLVPGAEATLGVAAGLSVIGGLTWADLKDQSTPATAWTP
jgi:hypothetical protein